MWVNITQTPCDITELYPAQSYEKTRSFLQLQTLTLLVISHAITDVIDSFSYGTDAMWFNKSL